MGPRPARTRASTTRWKSAREDVTNTATLLMMTPVNLSTFGASGLILGIGRGVRASPWTVYIDETRVEELKAKRGELERIRRDTASRHRVGATP